MKQGYINLMADSMSAFCLYQEDPEGFNWNWFQDTHNLNDTELQVLKDHMQALVR